jgi:multiple sugar transport system ATP-binding protein
MVFLRHNDHDVTAVFRERHSFAPGAIIHLAPDPAHLHCFSADSGERME